MKYLIHHLQIVLVTVITAVVTVTIVASSVSAADGGIGGRPANPDPSNPRTQSIFIYQLKGGESKRDEVLIVNSTNRPQTIDLYAVDGVLTNTGAYACKQEVEQKEDVGSWVTFDLSQVTLAAGASQKIPFNVLVPAGADIGEHNGCLVFQSAGDEGEVQGNVRIRTRQAIRMAITVPGLLKKDVELKSFAMTKVDRLQQFLLTISNKGNVSSDVTVSVALKTLWGAGVYASSGGYPVLANSSLDLNFVNETTPFWGGWYVASSKIEYDSRPGSYNVQDNEFKVTKQSPSIVVLVIPHPAAFAIYWCVLLAVIAGIIVCIRRRQQARVFAQWKDYTVKRGDTLTDLAARRNTRWELVARANKLTKPYVLVAGATIKLPQPPHASRAAKKTAPKPKKG